MTTVSTLKKALLGNPDCAVHFGFPDGGFIPHHFHVTEVGHVTKEFVDCGGTRRTTSACVLQTLVAHDTEHRLDSSRFAKILELTGAVLPDESLPVEIEYDEGTTALFSLTGIDVQPGRIQLRLASKHTACLAPDKCGLEDPATNGKPPQRSETQEPACDPASRC